ncbi:MAG: ThiF family adenylyltransferase [Deltaproteobacteria bacterium]|nr:ThiF family adenylyltransferase [Deltaproteobacteria bacterium]
MGAREDYFARVRPILGTGLSERTVAVENLSLCSRVVELLIGCLLERVIVRDHRAPVTWPLPVVCAGPAAGQRPSNALELFAGHLSWKNSFGQVSWLEDGAADLTIDARPIPAGQPPRVVWSAAERRVTMHLAEGDLWSYLDLGFAVARRARDLLLGREPWTDTIAYHGHRDWPFARLERAAAPPLPAPAVDGARRVLVIGCGSVGSEVVRWLAREQIRWTLVDSSQVSIFNPHRQWFGTGEVGQPKVEALARRLAPATVRALRAEIHGDDLGLLERLIEADRPDVALLATGTGDHGPLADLLWRRGVPHVAACAYPQARFFEVMPVIPSQSTPCLSCFRGNLYRGLESSAPMSDELAHFLYRELSPAERDRAYVDLVAEPATPIETGRVAEVAARCLVEVLARPGQRSAWFDRMLRQGTTCLLGGNAVEVHDGGETAYGITFPGQVIRLGLDDVVGAGEQLVCSGCGRQLDVKHRLELPAANDDIVDLALMQKCA